MSAEDVQELLLAAAVSDLARGLRNRHVDAEERRTGTRLAVEDWPPVDDFLGEALKVLQQRRARICEWLSR